MTAIELNGVTITEPIHNVLDRWQNTHSDNEQVSKQYVEYLTDVQDYLTGLILVDEGCTEAIADLLTKLILVKEDLKQFVVVKGGAL